MENSVKIKKIGTREDVYKGMALRTAGGLTKDDIITKQFGNKIIYISKKLSDKMKTNFNLLRSTNPNHLKNKRTHCCNIQQNIQNKKKHVSKTQKLSFNNDNVIKTIYYPELNGVNLNELKQELAKEEAIEDNNSTEQIYDDNGSKISTNKDFIIQKFKDFEITFDD